MIKRSTLLAAAIASALLAGQARADYSVTLSALNPTTYSDGFSTFTFAIPTPSPQAGADGFAQSFNVINVGEPTASGSGSGFVTLSENFSIVGTNGNTGSLSGTLTGTFTVTGALSSFAGSITNLVGSGFSVGSIAYSLPSPGSMTGSSNSGNVSFIVTPTAVPEPASMALVGLGLAGVAALRRRSAK